MTHGSPPPDRTPNWRCRPSGHQERCGPKTNSGLRADQSQEPASRWILVEGRRRTPSSPVARPRPASSAFRLSLRIQGRSASCCTRGIRSALPQRRLGDRCAGRYSGDRVGSPTNTGGSCRLTSYLSSVSITHLLLTLNPVATAMHWRYGRERARSGRDISTTIM